jgi:uncharacterized protein with FMN-binding domain
MTALYFLVAGFTVAIAQPAVAQSSDPFQSNSGPVAPAPRQRPVPREPEPAPPPPLAAFDGRYVGMVTPVGICGVLSVEVIVSNGRVLGGAQEGPRSTWKIDGEVAPDGSFAGSKGGDALTGKFQGGAFAGSYVSGIAVCGTRTMTLAREQPAAAGPFDGRYSGGMDAVSSCTAVVVEATVANGKLVGTGMDGSKHSWAVVGAVAPDGSFSGYNGTQPLAGKFAAGAFTAAYQSTVASCGQRALTLNQERAR